MALGIKAQALADAGSGNPTTTSEVKAPAVTDAKEITLTLKNDCANHLSIFAGSKKEVFDGKSQPIGGKSSDVLYLREGDVVCIMTDPKTIQACVIAKEGMSKAEINSSGNGFVK
jgi:hypothetical protein